MTTLDAPAIVELQLESAPESVALVRAGLKGAGTTLGFDPDLLDDLQMAASEACNNVVLHAYHGAPGPLAVRLTATHHGVELLIRDHGDGLTYAPDPADEKHALGLLVMQSLADSTELTQPPGGGTEVRLLFDRELDSLVESPEAMVEAATKGATVGLAGDVMATVYPSPLLSGVLGRIARTLAAQARFSVERFSDLHLLVESLVRHMQRVGDRRVSFALGAETRRLRLRIGPVDTRADGAGPARAGEDALRSLADQFEVEPLGGDAVLSLTLTDPGLAHAAP